jgi:arylsulfatase A
VKLFLKIMALAAFATCVPSRAATKPNIIVMLVDDLGATDLGCTGSTFYETPHLDRLAREGLRFNQSYSACTVCSPTRASLLTGKSPAALRLTDWIVGHVNPKAKLRIPDWQKRLNKQEVTLPERLHEAGYATGMVGKWHLSPEPPQEHGFDHAFVQIGGQPGRYFSPYKTPLIPDGPDGEFLSERLTTEAEHFIDQNKDRPFFLYFAHSAVHTPLQAKPEVVEKYRAKAERLGTSAQGLPVYAALVESVDDSIGQLRAKLDALGISRRTVIIFTSDNGGLIGNKTQPITTNLGMRAGKGSAYEGGVRVPLIVYLPENPKPGTIHETPTTTGDLFPTICDLAGLGGKPVSQEFRSLVPLFKAEPNPGPRALYWHYPHYHPGGATPYSAIREGDLRLIEFFEDNQLELYDLAKDPSETKNLAETEPEKVRALHAKLQAWRESVGAQLPTPNPDAKP